MFSISNILNALSDFLNEAQSLGVVKEYTLVPCEQHSDEALLKAKEAFSIFLGKVNNCLPVITEICSSSVTDNINVTEVTEQENQSGFNNFKKENEIEMQDNTNETSVKTEVLPVESPITKNLVQITVDTNEMKRRISAFISRKRKEVDEWNVQEFCGRSYIDEQDPTWEKMDSCARVDAIFIPRRGCKSHIKVSKVRNISGPQTQSQLGAKKIKQEPVETESQTSDASLQTIEERLLNMETHLKLKSDNTLRSNLFQRLKDLEDRILLLESTSPEYVHHLPNTDYLSPKKKNSTDRDKIYSNCSAEELQKKIKSLKESLKLKSPQIKSEPYIKSEPLF